MREVGVPAGLLATISGRRARPTGVAGRRGIVRAPARPAAVAGAKAARHSPAARQERLP